MVRKRDAKRSPERPFVPPERREPVSVERAVDEGMLIARSALSLVTKNHIIVRVLRDNRIFDRVETARFVKAELRRLAREQTGYAARVNREADDAAGVAGKPQHLHDYRDADFDQLHQRSEIYTLLAEELERLRDVREFVAEIVEGARANAWAELGSTIESRLDLLVTPPPGSDYYIGREERMRHLRDIDLAALGSRRR
jgi:hypothetical protein